MSIRIIEKTDIPYLIKLHKGNFDKKHFSSLLSVRLVSNYFNCLINHFDYNFAYELDSKVVGFLIGGNNPDLPVKNFLSMNRIGVLLVLFANPGFLIEKFLEYFKRFILKTKKEETKDICLYLLVVDSSFQSKGVGKTLLEHFENELLKSKVYQYSLSVRIDNQNAIRFYLKNNFVELIRNAKTIIFNKKIINEKL